MFFSIVIPLYNKELSVINTLDSILKQTFEAFEVIIVNDGSTDNSVEKVQQLSDNRIRLINQENQGVSAARNKGIKEARCDWICFLDADDLWKEDHLEELKKMIDTFNKDKVFCTSHTKSKYKKAYIPKMINGFEVIDDYFDIVMKHVDFFWTGAVCIHKEIFTKVGAFPLGISRGEDLYLWGKIGKEFRIIRSFKNTVNYNLDSENKLTNKKSCYNDSMISSIDLKGTVGPERKYFKRILNRRLKANLKTMSLKENLIILSKHNFNLLK